MSLHFEEIIIPGYEKVLKITDKEVGLLAAISIHSTTLGPALGGTRIYPYSTFESALNDVLRLSKGMTYKSAIAEAGVGGGKSVIIAKPEQVTKELLKSFAKAVDSLNGKYICAEDMGCGIEEVMIFNEVTPYVVGLPKENCSGDPSPYTAWGVYRGIQAVLNQIYDQPSVEGRTIAIQGLGHVGVLLAETLFWHGANLIVTDINKDLMEKAVIKFGAKTCHPDEILSVECDVLAPCAMGAIINSQTIPKLRCKAIAGAANNQLLDDEHAIKLNELGILYAPDFIINGGGMLNVLGEIDLGGYDPRIARTKTHKIYDKLLSIFDIAKKNQSSTQEAALALANYRIRYGIGKREGKIALSPEPALT